MNQSQKLFLKNLVVFVLLTSILIILFYYPLFDPNPRFRTYISGDFLQYYFPWVNYLLDSIHLGHFSIEHWNQYASSGTPSLMEATQYYLPTLSLKIIYELKSNFLSVLILETFIIAHLLIGAIGMYLLLRIKKINFWPAAFVSWFFICSGFMTEINWVTIIAIALIPWLLLVLENYLKRGGFIWLFLSAFIAFQIFASSEQYFVYMMLFMPLYFWAEYGIKKVNFVRLVPFYVLTIAMSAVLWIPIIEFSNLSVRQNYLSALYMTKMSNLSQDAFELIIDLPRVENSHLFIGTISMVIIAINLVAKKEKRDFRWLIAIAVIFLVSSSATFLQGVVRLTPVLNVFRWPFRLNQFIVLAFFLMLSRAFGSYRVEYKRDLRIVAVIMIISAVLYYLIIQSENYSSEQLFFGLIFLSLFALLIWARQSNLLENKYLLIMIGLIILLDLSRALNVRRDILTKPYQKNSIGQLALNDWFRKEKLGSLTDNEYRIWNTKILEQNYNGFLLSKNYSAGSFSAVAGDLSMATLKSYDDYIIAAKNNPNLLPLANIADEKNYLPRAFLIGCYKVGQQDIDVYQQISNPNFTGQEFVYLNQKPFQEGLIEITDETKCPVSYRGIKIEQKNDQITTERFFVDRSTLLFVSDNYYPGWNVYVNGEKKEVLRANYTFKAVALPPGKNEVVFKYEPKSIKWGTIITLISIFASLMVIICQLAIKKDKKINLLL